MIKQYQSGSLTWVDVLNPTAVEIRELIDAYNIPLEFTNDLTAMTPHTTTHWQKGIAKITLDWPIVKRTDINHPHEVKFIATKNALITIRFEDIQTIHQWHKDFEVVSMLKRSNIKSTGGHLMTALIFRFYKALDTKLDYLDSRLQEIQEEIFNEREREMVVDISQVNRRLITFRQTISAQENALSDLYTGIGEAFGKNYQSDVVKINEHFLHIMRRLDRLKLTIDELRETNNTLLSTKQNEIMKIFTILAFITFPLTLFTSMFGMNTRTTPIVGQEGDFWIIVGVMIVVSVCFFGYFKYKKWI